MTIQSPTISRSRWKTRRDAINGKARAREQLFPISDFMMLLPPTVAPVCQGSRTFSEARSKRGRNTTLSPTGIVRATLYKWPTELLSRLPLPSPLCQSPSIPLLVLPSPLRFLDSAVKNGESVLKLSQVWTETASPSTMYLLLCILAPDLGTY